MNGEELGKSKQGSLRNVALASGSPCATLVAAFITEFERILTMTIRLLRGK